MEGLQRDGLGKGEQLAHERADTKRASPSSFWGPKESFNFFARLIYNLIVCHVLLGGVSKGRSVAVGVSDRWKVTFFLSKKCQKCQKVPKNTNKWLKLGGKSVKKSGFYSIGATIHIHRDSRCLPYARFSLIQ